jgi:hypothetical protein
MGCSLWRSFSAFLLSNPCSKSARQQRCNLQITSLGRLLLNRTYKCHFLIIEVLLTSACNSPNKQAHVNNTLKVICTAFCSDPIDFLHFSHPPKFSEHLSHTVRVLSHADTGSRCVLSWLGSARCPSPDQDRSVSSPDQDRGVSSPDQDRGVSSPGQD